MAATVNMRIMYIFIGILMIYIIFQKKINKQILLSSIATFGYIAVLLISGVQGRYKSIIVPMMCILSAYCISVIYSEIKCKVSKVIEKSDNKK